MKMSNMLTTSSEQTARLKVTVQNLSPPEQGVLLSSFWLGFHDGSFDTFTPGEAASLPLENVAEDGFTGLEQTTPELQPMLEQLVAAGANLPLPEDSIATLFAAEEPNGIQALAFVDGFGLFPGSEFSFSVDVNPTIHTALSYASMVVPTNDGFVADAEPITLFSPEGVFVPQQIEIRGADVFDAGTEVNDEDPASTPILVEPVERFVQSFGSGTPEGGTIQPHPLLKEPGLGGFLDLPPFVNADFSRAPDETIAIISVELESVPEPQVTEVFGSLDVDVIEVNGSNQLIFGGGEDDLIDASIASEGGNRIYSGSGNDTLILGAGDRLVGAEGADRFFVTNGGDNTITGGEGADQFWIAVAEIPESANIITDFTSGEDVIGIVGLGVSFEELEINNNNGNALIAANDNNLAILSNVDAASLVAEDFSIV